MSEKKRPTRFGKRVIFSGLILLGLTVFAEFSAFLGYFLLEGSLSPISDCEKERANLIVTDREVADDLPEHDLPVGTYRIPDEVIHPYVGYVLLPGNNSSISAYGYWNNESPLQKRNHAKIVIAITGGSYADQFGKLSSQTLTDRLHEYEQFRNKEIVTVHLAMGGYKQPQQLMTLSYLLALGGEFDVVINLDGFNEVALHPTENGQFGINPTFPRNWYWRLSPGSNPILRRLVGLSENLRIERAELAKAVSASPLRFSVIFNLIWNYRDDRMSEGFRKSHAALNEQANNYQSYAIRGPPQDYADEQSMYEQLVATWKRCSIQMQRLCQANDIRYFHLLQSNQYVPGSKKMGSAERKIALNDESPYKKSVEQAYPLLIREGAELPNHNVAFTDLTGFFADVEEPVYIDDCCHLNKLGFDMIAAKVAELIAATDLP